MCFFEWYSPIAALFCSSPGRMKHRSTDISKGNPRVPGITWESEELAHSYWTSKFSPNLLQQLPFLTSSMLPPTLRRPCVRPPATWRATLWTGRHIVMWMCDHPNWNHWGLADAWPWLVNFRQGILREYPKLGVFYSVVFVVVVVFHRWSRLARLWR